MGKHPLMGMVARTLARVWPLACLSLVAFLPTIDCSGDELGQAAPSLQVTNWVRGEPVDLKRPGSNRVHVVLFWETYCDACMASLPQIVDLQMRLRPAGVEFLGITPEPPEVVRAFLVNSELGPRVNFAVASDYNRKTMESYMEPYGQSGIPRAFVVDQSGALVWCGHPLAGLEYALQQVLANKFDLESAKKMIGAEKLLDNYFRQAATNAEAAEVRQLGRKILADGTGNPWLLNNFAWRILQDTRLQKRDVELALHASKSACAATEWQRPTFLDTHASALFASGELTEAVRWEKHALVLCTNDQLRVRLEQTLKTFESGQTNKASQ